MKKLSQLILGLTLGFSFPALAETTTPPATETTETPIVMPQSATPTSTSTTTTAAQVNTVNINTASAAEIQDKLVGIGAKKAQAIVDFRTKNGNFLSIEQLTEVSGIGKATLEKNRDRIVLQ